MKIAIISDDLTGASDCGGQLIHYGLDVSVVLNYEEAFLKEKDAIIYNTNSRDLPYEEAYKIVEKVSRSIKNNYLDLIYKKIDSTMRGNVGQEINAVYDVFKPDFVIIAPAYPKNGRQVISGIYYLNGKKLSETEVSKDPKTPVNNSLIAELIENQSGRKVGHISHSDLSNGSEHVIKCLEFFKNQDISYITIDTVWESDLGNLVNYIKESKYSVAWCGSAGLMNMIPHAYGLKMIERDITVPKNDNPVLLVVGSVSKSSRKQLDTILRNSNVVGIEMKATEILLDDDKRKNELDRLKSEASNLAKLGKGLAIYSSDKVEETQKLGQELGYTPIEISNIISSLLGELAADIIENYKISNLFLTGGDIAYQVLDRLGVDEIRLVDEVESGIPVGHAFKDRDIWVVTKAGSFGSELAMIKAISKLQGGSRGEANNCNYNG